MAGPAGAVGRQGGDEGGEGEGGDVWAGARTLGASEERDEGGLSSQERTVIRLLAQGLTDEAIAKRLAVSPRTARRLANGLMERLDAASRFEFGVRAVQRGWLPRTE
ncbi:response regulator transcription factor [Streptomyces goshikiensis]|uniref:response regulator transcription factor n=1 Tax=Streptomyces goshikiensis TaxID=1942 RepID=UPI0036A57BDF